LVENCRGLFIILYCHLSGGTKGNQTSYYLRHFDWSFDCRNE